jgi:monovalent cation/proton antiporter MnhG/PhaG subunit
MRDVVATVLVVAGLVAQLLAVLGVVLLRDPLDRLHYLAVSTLATACIAAAVLVRESVSLIGLSALLVVAVVAFTAPVLSHVTARAVHRAEERQRR